MITVNVLWYGHQQVPWIKSISFDEHRFSRQRGVCQLDYEGWNAFKVKHQITNQAVIFKRETGRSIQVWFDGVNPSTGRGSIYVLVEPPTDQ